MRWIVSPRFDLTWFIGGAATGYAMLAWHAVFGLDMVGVWFAWFVLLDSPHFFATWSRAYLDREEWRTRGRLLAEQVARPYRMRMERYSRRPKTTRDRPEMVATYCLPSIA